MAIKTVLIHHVAHIISMDAHSIVQDTYKN